MKDTEEGKSPSPSWAMNLMEDKLKGEKEVPLNWVGLRTKLFMEFNLETAFLKLLRTCRQ